MELKIKLSMYIKIKIKLPLPGGAIIHGTLPTYSQNDKLKAFLHSWNFSTFFVFFPQHFYKKVISDTFVG